MNCYRSNYHVKPVAATCTSTNTYQSQENYLYYKTKPMTLKCSILIKSIKYPVAISNDRDQFQ